MRLMKKISVSENSSGTVKVIIGDVLEELSFAEFNKLTDKCIELRNIRVVGLANGIDPDSRSGNLL